MAKKVSNGGSRVLQWLLEKDQPAIRYLALTRLLDKPEHDPEVKEARKAIAERGWAAQILKNQDPAGWWAREDSLYRPKYLSTNWMLLVLSDLGATKEEPRIRKACELWISRFAKNNFFRNLVNKSFRNCERLELNRMLPVLQSRKE